MQEPDADFRSLARPLWRGGDATIWKCSRDAPSATAAHAGRPSARPSLRGAAVALSRRETARRSRDLKRELRRARRRVCRAAGSTAGGCASLAGLRRRRRHPHAGQRAGGSLSRLPRARARAATRRREALRAIACDARRSRPRRRDAQIAGGATIAADRVVIATGYATPEFKPLAGAVPDDEHLRHRDAAALVAPAAARSASATSCCGTPNHPYHYLRWTPDRRLLFGGLDRPRVPRATRRRRCAGARRIDGDTGACIRRSRTCTGYAWEGLFATTPDGLPVCGPTPPLSAASVRAGLWRQRHDAGLPRVADRRQARAGLCPS